MRTFTLSILAMALMTACGDTERPLRDMSASGGGPDEFAVIPLGALEIPETLTLPTPTPGGSNLTDPSPEADAIAALGGSASAQVAGGIPANDAALVAQASRYGVDPAIRAELAAADEALLERKRRANLFNPLNRDRYFPAYASQALDAYAELARLRNIGVAVPNPTVAQPQAQPQPQQAEPDESAPEPGLLQQALDPILEPLLRGRSQTDGVQQTCVLTTEGPGSELRRVCTPTAPEDQ